MPAVATRRGLMACRSRPEHCLSASSLYPPETLRDVALFSHFTGKETEAPTACELESMERTLCLPARVLWAPSLGQWRWGPGEVLGEEGGPEPTRPLVTLLLGAPGALGTAWPRSGREVCHCASAPESGAPLGLADAQVGPLL